MFTPMVEELNFQKICVQSQVKVTRKKTKEKKMDLVQVHIISRFQELPQSFLLELDSAQALEARNISDQRKLMDQDQDLTSCQAQSRLERETTLKWMP
jgi:hypothetical protein